MRFLLKPLNVALSNKVILGNHSCKISFDYRNSRVESYGKRFTKDVRSIPMLELIVELES